jgi:hypothetical protein
VTFDDALGILGIDRSAGKKGARRAYIKLIKVHKPDRDPVMFRRVREAYERVKDDIEVYARFYTSPPEPAPPEPAPPEPAPPEPAPPEPAPPPEPIFVEYERAPDRLKSILEGNDAYAALLERVPVDRAPVDPPRIDPIVDDVPRINPIVADVPRVDVLDNPLRLETHAERPIRIEPRSAPPSEPPSVIPMRAPAQAFKRGASPAELMRQAWAVFNDGGTAQKVERLMQRAFAAARVDPEADQPPPADAINLCLALFSNGRIVPARRVTRAMRIWLNETGLERKVMGGKLAASLAVLQAFIGLPADSPTYPVARIARATRDDALESAQPPLKTFARETPFSALTSADHFRDHAPLLDRLYGELLRTGPAVELSKMTAEVPARRGRGCLWLGGLMAVLFLIGLVKGACDGGSTYSRSAPPRFEVPKIEIPPIKIPSFKVPKIVIPAIDGPSSEMSNTDARRVREFTSAPSSDAKPVWLSVLCKVGDGYQASVCVAAISFDAARLKRECETALSAMRVLEATVMESIAHKGAVILARQHYEQACHKR